MTKNRLIKVICLSFYQGLCYFPINNKKSNLKKLKT